MLQIALILYICYALSKVPKVLKDTLYLPVISQKPPYLPQLDHDQHYSHSVFRLAIPNMQSQTVHVVTFHRYSPIVCGSQKC